MRNATTAPGDFVAWAASEAAGSPRFQREIDRLRTIASGTHRGGYPRTTGPLSDHDWETLERQLDESRAQPGHARPHAWRNSEFPTADGLRHVHEYLRRCRHAARKFLGHEGAAPLVHALVRGSGYQATVPTTISPTAPTGARASSLAAHISGASWRSGATALRRAWQRSRPREIDTFEL